MSALWRWEWAYWSRSWVPPATLFILGGVALIWGLVSWVMGRVAWPSVLTTWVFLLLPLSVVDPIRRVTSPDFDSYRLSAFSSLQLVMGLWVSHVLALSLCIQPLLGWMWLEQAPFWVVQMTLVGAIAWGTACGLMVGLWIPSTHRALVTACGVLLLAWLWSAIAPLIPWGIVREWGLVSHLYWPQWRVLATSDGWFWASGSLIGCVMAWMRLGSQREKTRWVPLVGASVIGGMVCVGAIPSERWPLWLDHPLPRVTLPPCESHWVARHGTMRFAAARVAQQAIKGARIRVVDPSTLYRLSPQDTPDFQPQALQEGDMVVRCPGEAVRTHRLGSLAADTPVMWWLSMQALTMPSRINRIQWVGAPPSPVVQARLRTVHELAGGELGSPTPTHWVSVAPTQSMDAHTEQTILDAVAAGARFTLLLGPHTPLPPRIRSWGLQAPFPYLRCPQETGSDACRSESSWLPLRGLLFPSPRALVASPNGRFVPFLMTPPTAWPTVSAVPPYRPSALPDAYPLGLRATWGKGDVVILASADWLTDVALDHPSVVLWWWLVGSPLWQVRVPVSPVPSIQQGVLWMGLGLIGGMVCWIVSRRFGR